MAQQKREGWWFGLCFMMAPLLVVYHLTTYPGVTGGDSGELLAEACYHGTAHPPGYPLYTMLARVVMMMPLPIKGPANRAAKANFASAVMGAATALFLYLTNRQLLVLLLQGSGRRRASWWGPALGPVLFSLSPLTWEYHTQAEVFALNNLLLAVLCWLTCRVWAEQRASDALLGAVLCGLALANQHTSLLYLVVLAPSVLAAIIIKHRQEEKQQQKHGGGRWPTALPALCVAAFLLGLLSPYYYLHWSAAIGGPKPGSWGDVTTLQGLLKHVLRSEYGTFRLGVGGGPLSEGFWERLMLYGHHVTHETHGMAPLLAALVILLLIIALPLFTGEGLSHSYYYDYYHHHWQSLGALVTLLLAWLVYVIVWHAVLSNLVLSVPMAYGVHARFWMQPNLVLTGVLPGLAMDLLHLSIPSLGSLRRRQGASAEGGGGDEAGPHTPAAASPAAAVAVTKSADVAIGSQGSGGLGEGSSSSCQPRLWWWRRQVVVEEGVTCLVVGVAALVMLIKGDFYRRLVDNSSLERHGGSIHRYGEALLSSLPPSSLLVSHTDLNWNPVRYLQACEGLRPDVTHLSFQLMPYPWFGTRQAPLYADKVTFPPLPSRAVSTNRHEYGNTLLVWSFLHANLHHQHQHHYPGGIYVDMMSVRDIDLGPGGTYPINHHIHRSEGGGGGSSKVPPPITLVPWGMLYRAQPGLLDLRDSEGWHSQVVEQARQLMDSSKGSQQQHVVVAGGGGRRREASSSTSSSSSSSYYEPAPVWSYPDGTWEFAAASTRADGVYQAALYLLTYAVEVNLSSGGEGVLRPYLDALTHSTHMLDTLLREADSGGGGPRPTAPFYDLLKNTALAASRRQTAVSVLRKLTVGEQQGGSSHHPLIMDGEREERRSTALARRVLQRFLREYPEDRHADAFRGALASMEEGGGDVQGQAKQRRKKGKRTVGGGGEGAAEVQGKQTEQRQRSRGREGGGGGHQQHGGGGGGGGDEGKKKGKPRGRKRREREEEEL